MSVTADYIVPYFRPMGQVVRDVKARLNDVDGNIWTEDQVELAVNDALAEQDGRVSVAGLYTLSGGWVTGTYIYSLPSYLGPDIQPQRRILIPYVNSSGNNNQFVWTNILGFNVEPDGSGGVNLNLEYNEGVSGTTNDARIIFWFSNGPMPASELELNAAIDADDTSFVIDSSVLDHIPRVGYVRINGETIFYAGTSDDGTNTTCSNLLRGVGDTTAASHSAEDNIKWLVALPSQAYLVDLYYAAIAKAGQLQLFSANNEDRDRHQWNMRYFQGMVDEARGRQSTNRRPQVRLTRRATGYGGFDGWRRGGER